MRTPSTHPDSCQRGATLIELMMALVVLAIGVLAVSQLFPAGSQSQTRDRLMSSANYHAQEKLEDLETKNWADADLGIGRHPAAGFDTLGVHKSWLRYYDVEQMTTPL